MIAMGIDTIEAQIIEPMAEPLPAAKARHAQDDGPRTGPAGSSWAVPGSPEPVWAV